MSTSSPPSRLYRYRFAVGIAMKTVGWALVEAIRNVQYLHGESDARLEARHYLDTADRRCVVDATTAVGLHFNRLFVGQLRRTIGDDGFTVQRVTSRSAPAPQMDAMSTTVGGELGR